MKDMPEEKKNELVTQVQSLVENDMTELDLIDILEESMLPVEEFFSYYRCAIMEIETKFRVLNEQFSVRGESNPIESIHSRIKSYNSIIRKVIKKGIPRNAESLERNIRDIAGVRVVCSFKNDIYRLAESFLRQDDIFLIEKKDYIANPKPNGYRSLHLIVAVPIFLASEKRLVQVEVQLRTIAMDFWASLEHKIRYKKNLPEKTLKMLAEDLKDCAEDSSELDDKMQAIKDTVISAQTVE